MRRAGCVFITVLIAMSFLCPSFAADGITHYIPDKEISVFMPFDILCITRDSDKTNAFYQSGYFDYATMHDYMLNNNLDLDGMAVYYQSEFALLITEYDAQDFNTASDLSLSIYEMQLKNAFVSQGATGIKSEIYQGKGNKAIRLSYTL